MKFKQWLENTSSSAGEFGNQTDPDENGLKRSQFGIRPVPDSLVADKLFGAKRKRHGKKFITKK